MIENGHLSTNEQPTAQLPDNVSDQLKLLQLEMDMLRRDRASSFSSLTEKSLDTVLALVQWRENRKDMRLCLVVLACLATLVGLVRLVVQVIH